MKNVINLPNSQIDYWFLSVKTNEIKLAQVIIDPTWCTHTQNPAATVFDTTIKIVSRSVIAVAVRHFSGAKFFSRSRFRVSSSRDDNTNNASIIYYTYNVFHTSQNLACRQLCFTRAGIAVERTSTASVSRLVSGQKREKKKRKNQILARLHAPPTSSLLSSSPLLLLLVISSAINMSSCHNHGRVSF